MLVESRRGRVAVDDVEELLLASEAPQSRRDVVHGCNSAIPSAPLIQVSGHPCTLRMAFASFRNDHEAIGANGGHEPGLCERGHGFDGITRATANRADLGHTDSRHDFPRRNYLTRSVGELRTTPA